MARFVLDEDIQLSFAEHLRSQGHLAWHIDELGLKGAPDEEVVQVTDEREAILVTADLGLADWRVAERRQHAGIVLIRMPVEMPTGPMNEEIMRLLSDVDFDSLNDAVLVIQPGRVRIRRYQE